MGPIVILVMVATAGLGIFASLSLIAIREVIGFLKWRHIYSADAKHLDALSALSDRVNEIQTRVGRLEMMKGL